MRNRIVAGLCDALLVIQTKRQGGSMITAKIAHSYHREILACPGSIMDPFHEGCNELIQSNMAGMLLNTQDIEHALGCHPQKIPQQLNLFEPEHELQREIYAVLQQGMTTADDLSFQIQKPIGEVLVALMELELLNAIQCLPGKCYALK
jgi:DNA processing protein